jgi:hypothetical protein
MKSECSLPCSQEHSADPILSQKNPTVPSPLFSYEHCSLSLPVMVSRDSSVSIVTRLRVRLLRSQGFIPSRGKNFSVPHRVKTASCSPDVKRPERTADHSPPAIVDVKNTWIFTSTPPYVFMARFLTYCEVDVWHRRTMAEQEANDVHVPSPGGQVERGGALHVQNVGGRFVSQ